MQRTNHAWRRRVVLPVALLLCLTGSAFAEQPKCLGPYTLNSNNYAPDTTGDDVEAWTGDFSVNLGITSGTLTVTVEAKLNNGTFASLGQMTTTAITQFHGPLHRLRFLVTNCSSCNATITACATKGD